MFCIFALVFFWLVIITDTCICNCFLKTRLVTWTCPGMSMAIQKMYTSSATCFPSDLYLSCSEQLQTQLHHNRVNLWSMNPSYTQWEDGLKSWRGWGTVQQQLCGTLSQVTLSLTLTWSWVWWGREVALSLTHCVAAELSPSLSLSLSLPLVSLALCVSASSQSLLLLALSTALTASLGLYKICDASRIVSHYLWLQDADKSCPWTCPTVWCKTTILESWPKISPCFSSMSSFIGDTECTWP